MRVQRAPLAARQPSSPAAPAAPFTAHVDLDLTGLAARLDRPRLLAEIVVLLVAACRAEGLIDDESPLGLVRPSGAGLAGWRLDRAVGLSAHAVGAAFDAATAGAPAPTARALTVVDLGATGVRTAGDWGLGGAGVATLGPAVATVVSRPQADGTGSGLAQRLIAPLGLTVPAAGTPAAQVVRILEAVARAVR